MRSLAPWVVVLALAGAVRAEDDPRKVFERATALFALHKFAEAAIQYERAFELKPDAAILYNAAQAHRLAGNKAHALELYESLLRMYGQKFANRGEVTGHIRELRHAIDADQRATQAQPMTTLPRAGNAEPARDVQPPPAQATSAPLVVDMTPPPPRVPVHKRKWFWPVIGTVGAVVIIGAITVGVVASTPPPQNPTPTFGIARGN